MESQALTKGREVVTRAIGALMASLMVVVLSAALSAAASPDVALAAVGDFEAAGASALSMQSSSLASANASTIGKKAVKNAKAIVKKAKATKGSDKAKLKKIFTYIATDKKWKGTFSFDSYLSFWMKARGTGNATYYSSAAGPKTMKGLYKKYAVDAYKTKKASCYHYASLFAVAAKQALGSNAKVKIANGTAKMKDASGKYYWNSHHSWVEVTLGKKTYVYDTQQGNYNAKLVGKKHSFGKYCGSKKSAVKATYKKYKGAKYCTVKL